MLRLNALLKHCLMPFLSFSFIFLLSGCTSQITQPTSLTHEKNMATIVITRDARLWGAALSAPIYINNKYIGIIGNGGTLQWVVQPGQTIVSTTEGIVAIKFQHDNTSTISFNAQKNKTYYVKVLAPYQMSLIAPIYEVKLLKAE